MTREMISRCAAVFRGEPAGNYALLATNISQICRCVPLGLSSGRKGSCGVSCQLNTRAVHLAWFYRWSSYIPRVGSSENKKVENRTN